MNCGFEQKIVKRWLWVSIPFTFATILVFYVLNVISLNLEDSRKKDKSDIAIEIAKTLVQHDFETIISHLHFLTNSEQLKGYLNNSDEHYRKKLEINFLNLEETSHLYDQIRLINETGQEVVRVDQNNEKGPDGIFHSQIVSVDSLQNKADRYYFIETAKIKDEQIYISPLDLNKENGKIQIPFKPMIRFAKPVRDDQGNFKGIVILNYLGDLFLNAFQSQLKLAPGDISLLNQDGFWLSSSDKSQEWGFMLPHKKNFKKQNEKAWEKIQKSSSGSFEIDGEAYTFSKIATTAELNQLNNNYDTGNSLINWRVVIVNKVWRYSWKLFIVDNKYVLSSLIIYLAVLYLIYMWAQASVGKEFAELNLKKLNTNLEAIVIDRTHELSHRAKELDAIKNVVMVSMATLAETRDPETGNHIKRTQEYVYLLAKELQQHPDFKEILSDEMIAMYKKTAPLHDIGKVGIPDSILLKKGKLTAAEFKIMQRHPLYGAKAIDNSIANLNEELKNIKGAEFLKVSREIIITHHEKWDGTGYPYQLKGNEIPLSGRIMALADVFDALATKRPYKPAFSRDKVDKIILEGNGSHFDPRIVDAFVVLQDQFWEVNKKLSEQDRKK
jgi:response regulator RpfG family c-di-GMP phosphodiesterase